MKEFREKVAVITGAASGIGRAIAERCIREGMKTVLADIEASPLLQAEHELQAEGTAVLAIRTDVSKADEVAALARITLEAFGAVHLLFNNAGVGAGYTVWQSTLADWQWVLGVNLWGVINGVREFVPIMLAQDTECHIVNTASAAGILPYHPSAPYQVSKHAVVALSVNLYFSLAQSGSKIKISVLCPGWVKTRIMESSRNRPPELQDGLALSDDNPIVKGMYAAVEAGISAHQVAEQVFTAIQAEQFYILTHPEYNPMVQRRMEDIVSQRNPAL